MVLENSQTQEQLPRDRKPPKAVMLYKSLPKGALNSAVEAISSPKVRQSTPSAIHRMLQHTKPREDLLNEGSRQKKTKVSTSSVVKKKSVPFAQTDKTKEIKLGVNPQLQVQLARAIVSLRDSSVTPKLLEETIPTHLLKSAANNTVSSGRGVASHRTHDPVRTEFVAGSGGLKDLNIDNKSIGKGSYAIVKTGYHVPSKMEVAIKIYDKLKMVDSRRRANLVHELQNLSEMDHPSIVKLYTKIEDATKIYLIMEFGGALHLKDFVKGRKEGWLTPSEVKVLFTKIVQGVQHMHSKNVVHRDLKLQNIVLKGLDSPKLVDFGFSRKGLYSHFEESCGTPNYMAPAMILPNTQWWMAPELLTNKKRSQAVFADIWALGVILHYLLLKRYPFRGRSEDELFANIKSGKTDLRGLASPAAVDLLTRLLHSDPLQRPLSAEILAHSWFKTH